MRSVAAMRARNLLFPLLTSLLLLLFSLADSITTSSAKQSIGITTALHSMTIPESAVQRFSTRRRLLKTRISLRRLQQHARTTAASSVPTLLRQLKRLVPTQTQTLKPPRAAAQNVKDAELRAQGITPLLAMVNQKSGGGGGGRLLLQRLRGLLHDVQVCDVQAHRSSEVLSKYTDCKDNMKLLVCGGDGTVSRVLDELFALNMSQVPIGVVSAALMHSFILSFIHLC